MSTMTTQSLYQETLSDIEDILFENTIQPGDKYGQITNRLLFKRVDFLRQSLVRKFGVQIQSGPFQGLTFHERALEGCSIPKLLGCYEAELHPMLTTLKPYQRILNIGCAEGYYAVGLAHLLPQAEIFAFDQNPQAQRLCTLLAQKNGKHMTVGGRLESTQLKTLIQEKTLIWCDIEGAEYELLLPGDLSGVDLLIELHQSQAQPERVKAFLKSFQQTHHVQIIEQAGRNPNQFPALTSLKQLDQWLSVWEFRGEATPWALVLAKTDEPEFTQPSKRSI